MTIPYAPEALLYSDGVSVFDDYNFAAFHVEPQPEHLLLSWVEYTAGAVVFQEIAPDYRGPVSLITVPTTDRRLAQQIIWISATRALVLTANSSPATLFVIERSPDGSYVNVSNILVVANTGAGEYDDPTYLPSHRGYAIKPDGLGNFWLVAVSQGLPDGASELVNAFQRRRIVLTGDTLSTGTLWQTFGLGHISYATWNAGAPTLSGAVLDGEDLVFTTRAGGYTPVWPNGGFFEHRVSGDDITIRTIVLEISPSGWRLGSHNGAPLCMATTENGGVGPIIVGADPPRESALTDNPMWNFSNSANGSVSQAFAPEGLLLVVGLDKLYGFTATGETLLATFTFPDPAPMTGEDWMVGFTTSTHYALFLSPIGNVEVQWAPRTIPVIHPYRRLRSGPRSGPPRGFG